MRTETTSDRRVSDGQDPSKRKIRFRMACTVATPYKIFLPNTILPRDGTSSGIVTHVLHSCLLVCNHQYLQAWGHNRSIGRSALSWSITRCIANKGRITVAVGSRQSNPRPTLEQYQLHKGQQASHAPGRTVARNENAIKHDLFAPVLR